MPPVEKIVRAMRANRSNVRFADALKVCAHYFGEYRVSGSHHVYKTPWKSEPWVNIQDKKGLLKPYQVKQILDAIEKLESEIDV